MSEARRRPRSLKLYKGQNIIMPKKWTREERKKYTKKHYYEKREKLFMVAALIVIFILLFAGLGYAIQAQADPFLTVVLIIVIIIMIPVSVFMLDSVTYEME